MAINVTDCVSIDPSPFHQGGVLGAPQTTPSGRTFSADPTAVNSFIGALTSAIAALPAAGGTIRVHPISGSVLYPFDDEVIFDKDIKLIFEPGAKTTQTNATGIGMNIQARCHIENLQFTYDATNIANGRSLIRLENIGSDDAISFSMSGGYASLALANNNVQRYMVINAVGQSGSVRTPGLKISDFVLEYRDLLVDDVTPSVQQTTSWVTSPFSGVSYGAGLLWAKWYRGVHVKDCYIRGKTESAAASTYGGVVVWLEGSLHCQISNNTFDFFSEKSATAFDSGPVVVIHENSNEGSHTTVAGNVVEGVAASHFVMNNDPRWLLCESNKLGRMSECRSLFYSQNGPGGYIGLHDNVSHNISGYEAVSDGSWDADSLISQFKGSGIETNRNIGDYVEAKAWSVASINRLTYRITNTGTDFIEVTPAPPATVVDEPIGTATLRSHVFMGEFKDTSNIVVGGNKMPFRNSAGPVYKVDGCLKFTQMSPDYIEETS